MDPLSISMAVLTLLKLTSATGHVFKDLRSQCKELPGTLHALNNEVSDLEVVLRRVDSIVKQRSPSLIFGDQQKSLKETLDKANDKLTELKALIDKVTKAQDEAKFQLQGLHAWRKYHPKLQALQEDIRSVRINLNVILAASNSEDLENIRLDLNAVSVGNSQIIDGQKGLKDDFEKILASSMAQMQQQFDQRMATFEEMLKQSSRDGNDPHSTENGQPTPLPLQHLELTSKTPEGSLLESQNSVGIRVVKYADCRLNCPCACHRKRKTQTSSVIDRVVGRMFVGYAGLPFLSRKCDLNLCAKKQGPAVNLEYWFPVGFFWSQILQFQMSYNPDLGPQFQMKTLRRIPDSSQSVNLALNGDIAGLKNLFVKGLASPWDVSDTRGYSLARWAMFGHQYDTCIFLKNQGADLEYRPIAESDASAVYKANLYLLIGGQSKNRMESLHQITQGSDFIEQQNYTILHKIVLGLSMLDLDEQIHLHPKFIEQEDAMGRTPLAWAAARGDEKSLRILIKYGGNLNVLDNSHSCPVTHAAYANSTSCVRMLLQSGANPELPGACIRGDSVHVACRMATDPELLQTLLDYGADGNAADFDGITPLMHACRSDKETFVLKLIEHGADPNVVSSADQTALTTAISNNSHRVLTLLLHQNNGNKTDTHPPLFKTCPRLKGTHLLETIADYADYDTIRLFNDSQHLALRYDKGYVVNAGEFLARFAEKRGYDVDERLKESFEELLDLLSGRDSTWDNSSSDGSEETVYEDALEKGYGVDAEKLRLSMMEKLGPASPSRKGNSNANEKEKDRKKKKKRIEIDTRRVRTW